MRKSKPRGIKTSNVITRASYHAVAFSRWEQTEDAPGSVEATGGWAGAIVIIRAGRTTLLDYEHGP